MAQGDNITTRFKVDISDLKAGIKEASKQIELANAQFKAATAGMEDWENSSEGLEAKLKQLNDVLKAQTTKLDAYRQQLEKQQEAYNENSRRAEELKAKLQELADNGVSKTSEEYKKYKQALQNVEKEQQSNQNAIDDLNVKILKQEAAVKSTESEIGKYGGELKQLYVEAGVLTDETGKLNKSVDESGEKAEKASDGFTVMKGALANLAAKGISLAIDGLVKLGKAAIDAGKQAVASYAEYEQLVGGVDTLFKDSSKKVQAYANDAYKTAGLSANDYMSTVTSFSASLLQGLGGDTEKAADYANRAIVDMADNANKMGTDMSMIQNAYQGFAKQNFTMLDNLKLGYGGTKTEMERLITDASQMTDTQKKLGVTVDEGSLSFDNIVNAISVMQDSLGISGTTAKEASETIEGSLNAMKSAWGNLLTGLADDNADMEQLISNFTDSITTYLKNVIPVAKQAISGIANLLTSGELTQMLSDLIQQFIPMIAAEVPKILSTVANLLIQNVPLLLDGAIQLFMALVDAIPLVVREIEKVLPQLISKILEIVPKLITALTTAIPRILRVVLALGQSIVEMIPSLIDDISEMLPLLIDAVVQMGIAIIQQLPDFIKQLAPQIPIIVKTVVELLIQNIPILLDGAIQLFMAIVEALPIIIDEIVKLIPALISAIVDAFLPVSDDIGGVFDGAVEKIKEVFAPIVDFFKNLWADIKETASDVAAWINEHVIQPVYNFFMKWIYPIIAKVGEIIAKIIEILWALAKFVGGWIKEHIVDPIVGKIIEIYEKVKEWVAKAWSAITDVFEKIADWFSEKWEAVKKVFEPVTTWLSDKFGEAWEKIKERFASWAQFWGGLWDKVKEKFSALGTKISDAIGGAVKAGINKVLDLIEGKINGAIGLINRAIDFINELPGVSIEPVSEVSLPRLAKGGVLPKGQVGLLEGSGTEAVVPLEKNKQWIRAVANDLLNELQAGAGVGAAANSVTNNSTQNFTQIINAPKQPSRIELYRQTRNLLAFAKEAGGV